MGDSLIQADGTYQKYLHLIRCFTLCLNFIYAIVFEKTGNV